jgi:hypothetical protein
MLFLPFIPWQKNTENLVEMHAGPERMKIFSWLQDRIPLEVTALANTHL